MARTPEEEDSEGSNHEPGFESLRVWPVGDLGSEPLSPFHCQESGCSECWRFTSDWNCGQTGGGSAANGLLERLRFQVISNLPTLGVPSQLVSARLVCLIRGKSGSCCPATHPIHSGQQGRETISRIRNSTAALYGVALTRTGQLSFVELSWPQGAYFQQPLTG